MEPKATDYRKISSKDFSLIYQKSDKPLQIVVSKRVAKKSVDRNRIRRIFKEALKEIGAKEVQIKIIVRQNIAGTKSGELAEKLKQLIKNEK